MTERIPVCIMIQMTVDYIYQPSIYKLEQPKIKKTCI